MNEHEIFKAVRVLETILSKCKRRLILLNCLEDEKIAVLDHVNVQNQFQSYFYVWTHNVIECNLRIFFQFIIFCVN